MCASRHVGILVHREHAAHKSLTRTRSRTAEIERCNSRIGEKTVRTTCRWEDGKDDLPSSSSAHLRNSVPDNPKRPRVLAPMGVGSADVQLHEQKQERAELSQILDTFAQGGAQRHGRTVEQELNRIKMELSSEHDQDGGPAATLPSNGTRVVLTGLVHGSNYNGREAIVVSKDGRDRLLVQICGASELCQLSIRLDNMAVLEEPDMEENYEGGRDFSQVHQLATLHAQQSAKREVDRLFAEAESRSRLVDRCARADSLMSAGQRVVGIELAGLSTRQRCRYGDKCAKPDCLDVHPWEEESTSKPGGSMSKLKATRGIYDLLAPAPRARLKAPKQKIRKASPMSSPSRGKDVQMAEAAVKIDRILAQAGLPAAARQAAHEKVIPLLVKTHGTFGQDSTPVRMPGPVCRQSDKSCRRGRLGARQTTGGSQRLKSECELTAARRHPGGEHELPRRPKTLHELRALQNSLNRDITGEWIEEDDAGNHVALATIHDEPAPSHVDPALPLVETVSETECTSCEEGQQKMLTWRDSEDPESRKLRISKLVEIKKEQMRKRKLEAENAMLLDALAACGGVLSQPLLECSQAEEAQDLDMERSLCADDGDPGQNTSSRPVGTRPRVFLFENDDGMLVDM
jgi:hypothetical protein